MKRKYGRNIVRGTLTEDSFNDMMNLTIHKLIEVAFFMSNMTVIESDGALSEYLENKYLEK